MSFARSARRVFESSVFRGKRADRPAATTVGNRGAAVSRSAGRRVQITAGAAATLPRRRASAAPIGRRRGGGAGHGDAARPGRRGPHGRPYLCRVPVVQLPFDRHSFSPSSPFSLLVPGFRGSSFGKYVKYTYARQTALHRRPHRGLSPFAADAPTGRCAASARGSRATTSAAILPSSGYARRPRATTLPRGGALPLAGFLAPFVPPIPSPRACFARARGSPVAAPFPRGLPLPEG